MNFVLFSVILLLFRTLGFARASPKPRVFVLTDIGNEPDDAMSLTRFLLYSNQFDVLGICATTSMWLQNETHIEKIQSHIAAYADIYANLSIHKPDSEGPWPSADELYSKTFTGPPLYGLNAVGEGHSSNGSRALREAIDGSEDTTWVTIWGGENVLAQAVWEYEQNHTQAEIAHFISKLKVYSISDQDNAGPWLRLRYSQIFWIVSMHALNVYNDATWPGISGEILYDFDNGGPDTSLVTNEWLQTNIRDVSSFGTTYPDIEVIMEGDTPSFLYLIQNGLGVPDHPYWGSWGGRYGRVSTFDNLYVNTDDADVLGDNGANFTSNHATIWRWREAYQWDFSGRMRWTATSNFLEVNHNPVVVVNNSTVVSDALYLNVSAGETVFLDARASYDPDVASSNGTSVTGEEDEISAKGFSSFRFWQYADASVPSIGPTAPSLNITQNGLTASVKLPDADEIPVLWSSGLGANFDDKTLHVIVEAWDNGTPSLVGYKRIVFNLQV